MGLMGPFCAKRGDPSHIKMLKKTVRNFFPVDGGKFLD